MSRKERDRLKVIEQLNQGLMGQLQAAAWLELSVRQVRRLLRRYQAHGDGGLVHQGRGKPSNRCLDEAIVARAKELLRTRYRGFGSTLAAEHLAADDAIAVSRESVRGWMIQLGLWGGQRKKRPHRHRRPRRACFGELVQIDTSSHDWLEGRGEQMVLITMIDDATGRKLARFFDTDSTATNMALIKLWTQRHGRPVAIYSDWASHFKQTPKRGRQTPKRGRQNALKPTQIQRALGELDIVLIAAHSAQAKGRVERSHGTDQDRLVKEMRLAGIWTMEAANRFLEEVYLARVEAKFAVAPASTVDAHRDAHGYDLEAIFSVQEERRVAGDYTVQVDGVAWQIERGEISGGVRRSKVTVERRGDGTMRLRWGDRYLKYHQAPVDCGINAEASGSSVETVAGLPGASLREDSLRSPSLHCSPGNPANSQDQPEVIPNPNTNLLPITLGESGHFYFAGSEDISTLR